MCYTAVRKPCGWIHNCLNGLWVHLPTSWAFIKYLSCDEAGFMSLSCELTCVTYETLKHDGFVSYIWRCSQESCDRPVMVTVWWTCLRWAALRTLQGAHFAIWVVHHSFTKINLYCSISTLQHQKYLPAKLNAQFLLVDSVSNKYMSHRLLEFWELCEHVQCTRYMILRYIP